MVVRGENIAALTNRTRRRRPLKKSRSITGLLVSFASPILLQRANNQLFIWFSRLFLLSSYSQMKGYAKDRRQTSHESVLRAL